MEEIVMATHVVTGDQYRTIDKRMCEIKRQLNQKGGSPLDPERVAIALQGIIAPIVIDCSAPAWCPDGWTIAPESEQIASRVMGELALTPELLALHLDPGQQDGKSLKGTALRTALAGKPVLTAHVLDYYLAHPELIPESWKYDENGNTRYIYFWGTIYRNSGGSLCVRCLCWHDGRWGWGGLWLDGEWRGQDPAAVRVP
jgi:hypothetical protein